MSHMVISFSDMEGQQTMSMQRNSSVDRREQVIGLFIFKTILEFSARYLFKSVFIQVRSTQAQMHTNATSFLRDREREREREREKERERERESPISSALERAKLEGSSSY